MTNIHGLKKKIDEAKINLRKLKGKKDMYFKITLLKNKIGKFI